MTTDKLILVEISKLPETLKGEILNFVRFLQQKSTNEPAPVNPKKRKFGFAKGKYKLTADFDAPLDDF